MQKGRYNRSKPRNEFEVMQRPSFRAWYIEEPMLLFGNGNRSVDQKLGLTTFGPCKLPDQNSAGPSEIRIGIIGTNDTINLAERLIEKMHARSIGDENEPFLRQAFPGFSGIFSCNLKISEQWKVSLTEDEVTKALQGNFEQRIENITRLFTEALRSMLDREPRPMVVIYPLPQNVIDYCATRGFGKSTARTRMTKQEKKMAKIVKELEETGQTTIFPIDPILYNPDLLLEASNLRRLMKAKSMEVGIPIQILKHRTLIGEDTQDQATMMWNLSVGLYYKAGGYLWRMADSNTGTCYIGISFFKVKGDKTGRMRTSMAQIFTHTGEGLVLRGDNFEWDERQGKTPRLSEEGARKLMTRALSEYKKQMSNQLPSRIVVHKTSKFSEAELKGFLEVIGYIRHDFIAFGDRGMRFLRFGTYPLLRGTMIQASPKNYFLYTRGYVPYLKTYPGQRIPRPLELIEHYGDGATPTIIGKEILGLTKMNWNTADFSTSRPITIEFAASVGDMLSVVPEEVEPRPQYYFYM